jgi:hypothetical protein
MMSEVELYPSSLKLYNIRASYCNSNICVEWHQGIGVSHFDSFDRITGFEEILECKFQLSAFVH